MVKAILSIYRERERQSFNLRFANHHFLHLDFTTQIFFTKTYKLLILISLKFIQVMGGINVTLMVNASLSTKTNGKQFNRRKLYQGTIHKSWYSDESYFMDFKSTLVDDFLMNVEETLKGKIITKWIDNIVKQYLWALLSKSELWCYPHWMKPILVMTCLGHVHHKVHQLRTIVSTNSTKTSPNFDTMLIVPISARNYLELCNMII